MTLDARQRALLREIGVRVWWPAAAPEAEAVSATTTTAGTATPAEPTRVCETQPSAVKTRAPAVTKSAPQGEEASRDEPAAAANGWQLGPLQALYGADEPATAGGPRWLLLTEQRHDSGGSDAQTLMQAMLRAAGLHQAHAVWLGPLTRTPEQPGVTGLEDALAHSEPDLVFIMGRSAAWALLETTEPLGQLRGQVHDLWGVPALVSYDCAWLLRHPLDKGKVWSDLCLALQVARTQYAERAESEDP